MIMITALRLQMSRNTHAYSRLAQDSLGPYMVSTLPTQFDTITMLRLLALVPTSTLTVPKIKNQKERKNHESFETNDHCPRY